MQWRLDHAGENSGVYFDHPESETANTHWSWLERWMAVRPWENHMLYQNGFAKEDDKTLKNHSPESYVNMPLATTTALRTCKGSSINGSVHTSQAPSVIMQAQKLQVQKQQGQVLQRYDQQSSDVSTTLPHALHGHAVLAIIESNIATGRSKAAPFIFRGIYPGQKETFLIAHKVDNTCKSHQLEERYLETITSPPPPQ
jgi:hypothetical protein